ncbi:MULTISPECIES: DUF3073 domain-containing protein [Arthrobacter]|uniref:Uncharacterized protein n=1 Tax=Arthrobacter woluwensis TaxID=156980 RepID=A0A1H4KVK5_9MICC|nr:MULTISPECIES: DUF3073 domain-containing protein [Arthrobacter]PSS43066.1 DUF3073 domain-containing protein [Arthrobacter woluwensis]QTF72662.1 DUF3073 domain-containing protein [Arthrobacter woluwensis]WFR83756.1 DUF3073 domain-containing protein [Arthrobacter sp. Y-9]SEB62560.1 Protein of unknown function [Arthrobacter woluwensis]
MGRGRQKAKATKQARDIKYYSPSTDYSALQRELGSANSQVSGRRGSAASFEADPLEPDYSEYEDKYADAFDEEDETDTRRIS